MLLPYLNKELIEAGCDEAGRGCLAGAVYAAAVILPKDFKNELLNDSKQLTEKQRYAVLLTGCSYVRNICLSTAIVSRNIGTFRIPPL